jgi:prepilin-type N-terminal cleavage/methylation domain-containing protein
MKVFVSKNWIPRIKYGAGLLEFTPAEAGAGMTKNQKGFTLIEIIILIVMAGILLPAIIVPFVTGVRESGKPEMVTTAVYLAHQKMEELRKFYYGRAPELNPGTYTLPGPPIAGYQWQWVISYVDNNFNPSGSDVGYKRIQVSVTDPEGSTYNVDSVVTDFP